MYNSWQRHKTIFVDSVSITIRNNLRYKKGGNVFVAEQISYGMIPHIAVN